MDLPESPKEVIDEVVAKVEQVLLPQALDKVEELLPELVANVQEVMPELTDNLEDAAKKVDVLANDVLNKFVERVPQAARAVEVVNEALAGVACSCGLFGWTLSASRTPRSPAKSEAPSSEVPK